MPSHLTQCRRQHPNRAVCSYWERALSVLPARSAASSTCSQFDVESKTPGKSSPAFFCPLTAPNLSQARFPGDGSPAALSIALSPASGMAKTLAAVTPQTITTTAPSTSSAQVTLEGSSYLSPQL